MYYETHKTSHCGHLDSISLRVDTGKPNVFLRVCRYVIICVIILKFELQFTEINIKISVGTCTKSLINDSTKGRVSNLYNSWFF